MAEFQTKVQASGSLTFSLVDCTSFEPNIAVYPLMKYDTEILDTAGGWSAATPTVITVPIGADAVEFEAHSDFSGGGSGGGSVGIHAFREGWYPAAGYTMGAKSTLGNAGKFTPDGNYHTRSVCPASTYGSFFNVPNCTSGGKIPTCKVFSIPYAGGGLGRYTLNLLGFGETAAILAGTSYIANLQAALDALLGSGNAYITGDPTLPADTRIFFNPISTLWPAFGGPTAVDLNIVGTSGLTINGISSGSNRLTRVGERWQFPYINVNNGGAIDMNINGNSIWANFIFTQNQPGIGYNNEWINHW